jgi:hypothetical protein
VVTGAAKEVATRERMMTMSFMVNAIGRRLLRDERFVGRQVLFKGEGDAEEAGESWVFYIPGD